MENIPFYISVAFGLILLLALIIFYKAAHNSRSFLTIILLWIIIQSALSLSGFYTLSDTTPPRILLLVSPPVLFIILLFTTKSGRKFIDNLDLKYLTILHMLRILVEFILLDLYTYEVIPQIMTFEGRNFDILSGLTAPIIYYLAFVKKNLNKNLFLAWNLICMALLINVVAHGILATPGKLQQIAFDQPNIAIQYFPFNLLPGFLVPLILFAHLATIRKTRELPKLQ